MPVHEKCMVYRFDRTIPAGITVNRYGRVLAVVVKPKAARAARPRTRPLWADHLLRLARERKGWNQGQLAEAAGVRANTLSAILSGAVSPQLWTLECLATAMAIPVGIIFLDTRQTDILDRQAQSEAALTNEDEMYKRLEQRLLARFAGDVRREIENEVRSRPVSVTPAKRTKRA